MHAFGGSRIVQRHLWTALRRRQERPQPPPPAAPLHFFIAAPQSPPSSAVIQKLARKEPEFVGRIPLKEARSERHPRHPSQNERRSESMTSFFSKRLLINLAVIAGAIGANVSVAYAVALVGPARAPLLLIVAITAGSGALIPPFGVRERGAGGETRGRRVADPPVRRARKRGAREAPRRAGGAPQRRALSRAVRRASGADVDLRPGDAAFSRGERGGARAIRLRGNRIALDDDPRHPSARRNRAPRIAPGA